MKALLIALAAGAATLSLGACAMDDNGYGHHSHYGVAVGYDGFYDDAYGPFYDGYWGNDGFFYYSNGAGHPYRRDEGRHFRHDGGAGFHEVHGQRHDRDNDHDRH